MDRLAVTRFERTGEGLSRYLATQLRALQNAARRQQTDQVESPGMAAVRSPDDRDSVNVKISGYQLVGSLLTATARETRRCSL